VALKTSPQLEEVRSTLDLWDLSRQRLARDEVPSTCYVHVSQAQTDSPARATPAVLTRPQRQSLPTSLTIPKR